MEKLKQELELLLKDETTGEFKENLESAISEIKYAIDSGKDADSRRTLSEVESVLDSIEKNSAKMSSVASNALNVFNVISKLF